MSVKIEKQTLWQECGRFLRVFIALGSVFVALCGFTVSISIFGRAIFVCQALLIFVLLQPSAKFRTSKAVTVGAILVFVLLLVVGTSREVVSPNGGEITRLPDRGMPNRFDQLLPEEDIVFVGTRMMSLLLGVTPNEANGLMPAIAQSYQTMREQEGNFTSPLLSSLFGLSSANAFDVLSFCGEKCRVAPRHAAIVHIHGVGGNWALICWRLAQAADVIGAEVICPSRNIMGSWYSKAGQEIINRVFESLKGRDISKIYLSGLSAGALSISVIAPKLADKIDGLILLYGAHPNLSSSKIRTLYIYGSDDERFPLNLMRAVGKARKSVGDNIEIHEIPGDHLTIVKQPQLIIPLIEHWLQQSP